MRFYTSTTCEMSSTQLTYFYQMLDTSGLHTATRCVSGGMSVTTNSSDNIYIFRSTPLYAQYNCSDVNPNAAASARGVVAPVPYMLLSALAALVLLVW